MKKTIDLTRKTVFVFGPAKESRSMISDPTLTSLTLTKTSGRWPAQF